MYLPMPLKHLCLGLALLAGTSSLLVADTFSFELIPPNGSISGPAEMTLGWGYSLSNNSSKDWLVTTALNADAFLYGSPNSVFDFPVLNPGAELIANFDPSIPAGLYEFTWDASAPSGATNTGDFTLSAQWWTGDPLMGGVFLANADTLSVPYSVSLFTPEPESLGLILIAFAFLCLQWQEIRQGRTLLGK